MRSELEQPLALEYHDKPGAYFVSTGQLRENKGGDVKRAGALARTSEHDRPIFMPAIRSWCYVFTGLITAARFAQLRRARPRSATGPPSFLAKTPFFQASPEKTTSIAGFLWQKSQ